MDYSYIFNGNRRFEPIRFKGQDTLDLLEELTVPKVMTETQKQLWKEVEDIHKKRIIKETYDKFLTFIQEGHYSDEELNKIIEEIDLKQQSSEE